MFLMQVVVRLPPREVGGLVTGLPELAADHTTNNASLLAFPRETHSLASAEANSSAVKSAEANSSAVQSAEANSSAVHPEMEIHSLSVLEVLSAEANRSDTTSQVENAETAVLMLQPTEPCNDATPQDTVLG